MCIALTFSSIPLCALISQHLGSLASKFPATKFLKSVATSCIPNYPDKNLPTVFVYYEGDLKGQIVGPFEFGGMNLTMDGEKMTLLSVSKTGEHFTLSLQSWNGSCHKLELSRLNLPKTPRRSTIFKT